MSGVFIKMPKESQSVESTAKTSKAAYPLRDILESVKKIFATNKILYLIHYGSSARKDNFNDIDLCLVEKGFEGVDSMKLGNLDIVREGTKFFCDAFIKKDPAYATEAILSGNLLIGDINAFNLLREKLSNGPADINYLLKSSFREYFKVFQFLDAKLWLETLKSLEYALSYRLFAQWYAQKQQPVTYENLTSLCSEPVQSFALKLKSFVNKAKKSREVEKSAIAEIISEWEDIFLNQDITLNKFRIPS